MKVVCSKVRPDTVRCRLNCLTEGKKQSGRLMVVAVKRKMIQLTAITSNQIIVLISHNDNNDDNYHY